MDTLTNSRSATSGLATWRARQAEEKRLKLLELEHYRAYATTEIRDGREFKVVRIPDMYDVPAPRLEPPVQIRRTRGKRAA